MCIHIDTHIYKYSYIYIQRICICVFFLALSIYLPVFIGRASPSLLPSSIASVSFVGCAVLQVFVAVFFRLQSREDATLFFALFIHLLRWWRCANDIASTMFSFFVSFVLVLLVVISKGRIIMGSLLRGRYAYIFECFLHLLRNICCSREQEEETCAVINEG